MEKINSQPVSTPAFIPFAIVFTMALLVSLIATIFHLADFGNVQSGLFWLVSVLAPAAAVGITVAHHYEGELVRSARRAKALHGKGWDQGYEEGVYQAYLVVDSWGEGLFENFEEFRGHIEDYS